MVYPLRVFTQSLPLYRQGNILLQDNPMSIQPKKSWLYQGLALLLWLACIEPACSSSLFASGDRSKVTKITPYLLGVDPPASTVRPDFDPELLKNHSDPKQTEHRAKKLLAKSAETTATRLDQDPSRNSRYKRSLSVQAMGTATLGSLSVTKALGADPRQSNWLSSLAFTMTFAGAIGVFFIVRQPSRYGKNPSGDTYWLNATMKDSGRKLIQATAKIYWNKKVYKGSATEIGLQSMRIEVDSEMRGLKILMPMVLVMGQEAGQESRELPQRLLVQVVSIKPLSSGGKHRSVLELRFPKRWQQQQSQRVKELIEILH